MDEQEYEKMFLAEEKGWWFRGRKNTVFDLVDGFLGERKGLKVLDVGCGTGFSMLQLQKYGEVSGIDVSEIAVEFCRSRGIKDVRLAQLPHFEDELTL